MSNINPHLILVTSGSSSDSSTGASMRSCMSHGKRWCSSSSKLFLRTRFVCARVSQLTSDTKKDYGLLCHLLAAHSIHKNTILRLHLAQILHPRSQSVLEVFRHNEVSRSLELYWKTVSDMCKLHMRVYVCLLWYISRERERQGDGHAHASHDFNNLQMCT